MNNFFETLSLYLSYSFVRYALITGTLIALCSSLLGVTLVLRRFSYIGDGLSHVAFGAISFASVFGLTDDMILVLPMTIACAILLLLGGANRKIKGDASIAMVSVSSLAIGYLLMNVFKPSTNLSGDVCSTLFGSTSILTLTKFEVIMCVVLSLAVIAIFIISYNKIFAITFDEVFAKSTGVKTDFYNLVLAIVIALIIVLAMNLVGSLLISALIIFPSMSAIHIFKSFKSVSICSAILSTFCALLGMFVSIFLGTPVGSTIVASNIIVFFISLLLSRRMRNLSSS